MSGLVVELRYGADRTGAGGVLGGGVREAVCGLGDVMQLAGFGRGRVRDLGPGPRPGRLLGVGHSVATDVVLAAPAPHLIERTRVGARETPYGAVGGDAFVAGGIVDVARTIFADRGGPAAAGCASRSRPSATRAGRASGHWPR